MTRNSAQAAFRPEEAEEICRSCGAERLAWISPEEIRTTGAFRISCEMNMCGQYGRSWSCPPALASIEELREQILQFGSGLVFQADYPFADAFDYEAMEAGALAFYGLCRCIETGLRGLSPDILVLGAGSCRECRRCTYPDAPCVRPQGPVLSLEAYGVDVTALCDTAGLPYAYTTEVVPYTGLALLPWQAPAASED